MSYTYLVEIALILLSTKLLGLLTKKIQMPQVVGALLAGLILGPAMLNILHETEFIKEVAELGVIVLMFTAGLETNISELKKAGKASFVIATLGVLFPLAGGFAVAYFFNRGEIADAGANLFLQNMFIGVVLTATSVSITVETLKELGKLTTRAGNAILGAALIDDILGIIALTVITSLTGESVNLLWILIRVVLFFVFAGVLGYIAYRLFQIWIRHNANRDLRRFSIVSFVFCLLLAYIAERYFGVADITGAFLAGLIISNTQKNKYIASRFEIVSYMFLSPIFFASIGIEVSMPKMSATIIIFSVLLLIVAIITKVIGCGLGAKVCKYTNSESLQIGIGMISRGEVALIVTSKGASIGLMNTVFYGPVIVMVVLTTIITPILLKLVFHRKKSEDTSDLVQSDLVEMYEQSNELDLAEQHLLEMDEASRNGKKDTANKASQ